MIAFLFPGQGAQRPGMLADLPTGPTSAATLDVVSEHLGHDIRDLDTAQALAGTVASQVALFAVGVASARCLAEEGIRPDVVAGHSVGAFAAAVTAGVLSIADGLAAVRIRAQHMHDLYPHGYGLLAVLGLPMDAAQRLVAEADSNGDLFVAMENAEDQIVLAGSENALLRADANAPRFGARTTHRLRVAVPAHCPLMTPVADAVAVALEAMPSRPPTVRYLSAMTARAARTSRAVRADLAGGVANLVRWRDTTDLLTELGASLVAQLPPGHATAALFAAAHRDVPLVVLDDAPFHDSVTRLRTVLRRAQPR